MARELAEAPRIGDRIAYDCLVCGSGAGDATYIKTRGGWPEWMVSCWTPACQSMRGQYLVALAEALGLPPGATKESIVGALRGVGKSHRHREPEKLPSDSLVAGWSVRLFASPVPLAYLSKRRRIKHDVLRAAEVGWDGTALTFPMREGTRLVALKRRLPIDGAQMDNVRGKGRPWPLYPPIGPRPSWALLVAGELDALRGRSANLPTLSVTLGAGHWRDAWTEQCRRFNEVVVCFDNNEALQAEHRVEALRAAGINARRLDLAALGLDAPEGDLSNYLSAGGDPRKLYPPERARRIVRRRRHA